MINVLKTLSDMRGVSGFEYRNEDEVKELFAPWLDEVYVNNSGSVVGVKKCENPIGKVMLEAHMDEIGLMVKGIDEKGFITFVNIGGVDGRTLPGSEVAIHGKTEFWGVVGAKPRHLQGAGEAEKSVKINDMAIDTGLDAETVKSLVSVGDSITMSQSVGKLLGENFSGKCIDDRGGVAILLKVMEDLKDKKLPYDLYFVATVQEEVGLRGAKTVSYEINPDLAIAIDVCHGITPDNSYNAFELGSGTVISKGPNIHPAISKKLTEVADNLKIKYSIDVDGGDTGTDAWAIQVAREGIATGLLSIPLKYMHTSVETVNLEDLEATRKVIGGFLENLKGGFDFLCF